MGAVCRNMVPQQLTVLNVFREFMGNWSLGVGVGVGVVSCTVQVIVLQSVDLYLPHTFLAWRQQLDC